MQPCSTFHRLKPAGFHKLLPVVPLPRTVRAMTCLTARIGQLVTASGPGPEAHLSSRSEQRRSNCARDSVASMCFGPSAVAVMNGRLILVLLRLDSSIFAFSAASVSRCSACVRPQTASASQDCVSRLRLQMRKATGAECNNCWKSMPPGHITSWPYRKDHRKEANETRGAHLAVLAQVQALVLLEVVGQPVDDALVEVVTAQVCVAAGGQHLEHAIAHLWHHKIKVSGFAHCCKPRNLGGSVPPCRNWLYCRSSFAAVLYTRWHPSMQGSPVP